MTVHRINPKCLTCGGDIQGKYRDYSSMPQHLRPIGDSFICWDYSGHKCTEKSTEVTCLNCDSAGEVEHKYPLGVVRVEKGSCDECSKDITPVEAWYDKDGKLVENQPKRPITEMDEWREITPNHSFKTYRNGEEPELLHIKYDSPDRYIVVTENAFGRNEKMGRFSKQQILERFGLKL